MATAWIPLTSMAADPTRIGEKARRLIQVQDAGLRIPRSWILPADSVPAEAPSTWPDPTVHRWMLRSSSPHEDRPGASAAGLFRSVSCLAVPEELGPALQRVLASATSPAVRTLVDGSGAMAVLAQPHLELGDWWTVEIRPGTQPRVEGWRQALVEDGGHRAVDLAARAARACGLTAAMAEIGEDAAGLVVLQVRPAPPDRAPVVPAAAAEDTTSPGEDWRWDRAHSPGPLAPLLATLFDQWLAARPDWPSRLFHGRWFDREVPTAPTTREEARRWMQAWDTEVHPALTASLVHLETGAETLEATPASWRQFCAAWLEFQERYFAAGSSSARRWAAEQVARPDLSTTLAAARGHALTNLVEAMRRAGAPRARGELATWMRTAPAPVEARWTAFLAENGHVAPGPWDGRGAPWREDPRPLLQEIARRLAQPPRMAHPIPQSTSPELATRILVRCEDDDELLSRAYAAFRSAARRVSPEGLADHVMDIAHPDLLELLAGAEPSEWFAAIRRGRARVARWEAWHPDEVEAEATELTGVGAAGGRATGPVRRLTSARAEGGPAPGEILVVPTVVPADALVFDRVAAVVCETGDALGHAAMLAREHRVPLVVGVADARWKLRAAREAHVDGDRGRVQILR